MPKYKVVYYDRFGNDCGEETISASAFKAAWNQATLTARDCGISINYLKEIDIRCLVSQ